MTTTGTHTATTARPRTLAVRLDNAGDVLLTGPAVRALAAGSRSVVLLSGPNGRDAAAMLPGVDEVLTWRAPWIDPTPEPVDPEDVHALVKALDGRGFDRAVVFTSFHQSPLPTALLLRLAGVPWVGAISEDYPGSLLDLRHLVEDDPPEAERARSLAEAAGFPLPPEDDGRLAVRQPLPDVTGFVPGLAPEEPYIVLHPGTSVPARAWPVQRWREACALLTRQGYRVVVTGTQAEVALSGDVAGQLAHDLGGRTTFAELAALLDRADVVVAGNTGPAHLAAAVGTPVVSLFAPTVPAARWAPYGVATVLLGDQQAPCRGTRATVCPVPGHPCLTQVTAEEVLAAVEELGGRRG